MEKILLVTILVTLIIGIALIIHVNKIHKNKFIEFMIDRITLENMDLNDCFSKDVVSLYKDILKDTNKYYLTPYTLKLSGSDISIWACNDVENRRFYTTSGKKLKEVEEMNSKLTHYDKLLLDKLVKSFENRQEKLVTKFFI